MTNIAEAEAKLRELEKPGADVATANNAFRMAEYTGDPEKIAAAKSAYDDAVAAEKAANINSRDIDRAAQAVLDARGEAHTETNLVPPGVSADDHHGEKV